MACPSPPRPAHPPPTAELARVSCGFVSWDRHWANGPAIHTIEARREVGPGLADGDGRRRQPLQDRLHWHHWICATCGIESCCRSCYQRCSPSFLPSRTRFLYTTDANCQLQRNQPRVTGQHSCRTYPHDRGSLLLATLRVLQWYMHSTGSKAHPTARGTTATYSTGHVREFGEPATWYNGYKNGVKQQQPSSKHQLVLKQIDYVRGSRDLPIQNIRVHCDPSIDKYGRHYDHGMIVTTLILEKSRWDMGVLARHFYSQIRKS